MSVVWSDYTSEITKKQVQKCEICTKKQVEESKKYTKKQVIEKSYRNLRLEQHFLTLYNDF